MEMIPKNRVEYTYNENEELQTIIVSFQTYQGEENLNARIVLTQDYIDSVDDSLELSNLTKQQEIMLARGKASSWILLENDGSE